MLIVVRLNVLPSANFKFKVCSYSRNPSLIHGVTFQDPQWILEITDSTEPYIH